MSAVVCPNGHPSESTDYCDVCGEPIGAASSPPAPTASGATPAPGAAPASAAARPVQCPNCGSPAPGGALFCENCGYDFTTGALPDPVDPPSALSLDPPSRPTPPAPVTSAPSVPGTPSGSTPPPLPTSAAAPAASTPSVSTPPPLPAPGPGPAGEPAGPGEPTTSGTHLPTPPVPGPDQWVVEIWIDPDWYTAQQPEDPMPSAGLPGLVVLRERSVLVGRPSVSRGIHPQVDCGADTGVSRRHCQLSTDGQRWWVEDLQSSNGTYVSPAGEPLPTDPIPAGQRRELSDGDRVYLGAWTRLVVRKALPGEV
ncbi:phosphopeptide-binding protein [Cellulosimicrobium cellulans]|uniref:Phosphopeptide-binding protein n=1 Tax=Cellulosimicrobium cellulans TaxID=1710 RepID=A0A1Y0HXG0_CELCE|nr:FHA domain-containing protein [Cellulosimicrobium cellulans]ARU52690.1 phosphopeptide-binding protein [Cellulosimicrobium cellulans]